MPYELESTIECASFELEDLAENAGTDEELLDSYVNMFQVDQDLNTVTGVFLKDGHRRKKECNRENVKVSLDGMTPTANGRDNASTAKRALALELKDLLHQRFTECQSEIYLSMKIYDPQYWLDDEEYGIREIRSLVSHFRLPLNVAGFDERKVFTEWRGLKRLATRNFSEFFDQPKVLWQKILVFRRSEFPNICLIIELITTVSGSNCAVERAFSILTMLLTDQRLTLRHEVMEDIMIIKCNDNMWSCKERKDIIDEAVTLYLQKRRKETVRYYCCRQCQKGKRRR